jgi:hypothetical protein
MTHPAKAAPNRELCACLLTKLTALPIDADMPLMVPGSSCSTVIGDFARGIPLPNAKHALVSGWLARRFERPVR